jgi:hypothetical protein
LATVLGPKRLELLHEAVPAATVVAVLVNRRPAAKQAAGRRRPRHRRDHPARRFRVVTKDFGDFANGM